MRWWPNMKFVQRQRTEQRRSCMCWSSNSRINKSCIDERMSCSNNRYSRGPNMHKWMKFHLYKLWIHPNSWHGADKVSSVVDHMQGNLAACMSLCARMQSHPFGTHTKAKTRSNSEWSWTCISRSWRAQPPTHVWIWTHTLCVNMLSVWSHPGRPCACYQMSWMEEPYHCTQTQWRKEFDSARCHHWAHGHHHGWPSLASITNIDHHKDVKELVSTIVRVSVMSCMACLIHFVSHGYICIVM